MQFIINEIYWALRILFTSECWIRNNATDKKWDAMILSELETPVFKEVDKYLINLNGKDIWVANKFYDGVKFWPKPISKGMPTRRTVFKFYDALERSGL